MRRFSGILKGLAQWLTPLIQLFKVFCRRCASLAEAWGVAVLWFRSSFLPSQNYLIILSVVVGILTGFGSVAFVYLLRIITSSAAGIADSVFGIFGPAKLVLLPAMGGLLSGPLIFRYAKEARGHGVPEVMTALAAKGGVIRKRVVSVKVIASSLTIGFGGAAGREGPMVQIGSAIGSAIGQMANLTTKNVRTLVACGAAGGSGGHFQRSHRGSFVRHGSPDAPHSH